MQYQALICSTIHNQFGVLHWKKKKIIIIRTCMLRSVKEMRVTHISCPTSGSLGFTLQRLNKLVLTSLNITEKQRRSQLHPSKADIKIALLFLFSVLAIKYRRKTSRLCFAPGVTGLNKYASRPPIFTQQGGTFSELNKLAIILISVVSRLKAQLKKVRSKMARRWEFISLLHPFQRKFGWDRQRRW